MKIINLLGSTLILTGTAISAQAASLSVVSSSLTPSFKTIPTIGNGVFTEDYEANAIVKVMNNHDTAVKLTTLSFNVEEFDDIFDDDVIEDFAFLDLSVKLEAGGMAEIMRSITISAETLEANRLLGEVGDFSSGDRLEFELASIEVAGVKHTPEPSAIFGIFMTLGIGSLMRSKRCTDK